MLFVNKCFVAVLLVCLGGMQPVREQYVRDITKQNEIKASVYFVDSRKGDDQNNGLSESSPWKSLKKVGAMPLKPGDVVRFKRGSAFTEPLVIHASGTANQYVRFTDYGNAKDSAPKFTNPTFSQDNYGNCIRIKGSYIIIEHLYFHNTLTYVEGNYPFDGGWEVWEMGAVFIDKAAEHCIVRDNEFYDCVAGVRSYGKYAQICRNYIHDCNRPLKKWNWGPIGIWLGGDYQTVVQNTIINMQVNDPDRSHFTNGVGGGAFEIDDGRYPKSHITISRNFTRDNCGFLETVFNDVVKNPDYRDWKISFNISDDYQAFVKLRFAKNCQVDHNTIIRRKINATELGVFVLKGNQTSNKIRNNIIVTANGVKIFNVVGKVKPRSIISNNLYYSKEELVMGDEGPGISPYHANPLFQNIDGLRAEDFGIRSNSPAIDKALSLDYDLDFSGRSIPSGDRYDVGACEYFFVSKKNTENQSK